MIGPFADAIVDVPGPVYVRLKRGEIPVIFDAGHRLGLDRAQILVPGGEVVLYACGMMVAPALAASRVLAEHGVEAGVVGVPVIKPLDTATVVAAAAGALALITAENHSIIGGLGSAVAEAVAEAGIGRPLRRVGLRDTFAEGAKTAAYLFDRYGLSTQALVDEAWAVLGRTGAAPAAPRPAAEEGRYAPV